MKTFFKSTGNSVSGRILSCAFMFLLLISTGEIIAQTEVEIGTGTSNSPNTSPFHGQYSDTRKQFMITASELTAAGATSNDITSLAFNMASQGSGVYDNFTVKIGHTSLSSFSFGQDFEDDSGFTVCFSGAIEITQTGWKTINFSSNFFWNGTDNIIIQTCYDNANAPGSSSSCYYTSTSGVVLNAFENDASGTGCSQAMSDFSSGGLYGWRPNMKLTFMSTTPMTYSGKTASIVTTDNVETSSTNNAYIKINIQTTGGLNPLSTGDFSFASTGTSDLFDISNAKLFYTGSDDTFSATQQVGSTITSPGTSFNISSNQTLVTGDNFFWLCYDIPSGATEGNTTAAECLSVIVDGNTESFSSPTSAQRQITVPPIIIGTSTTINQNLPIEPYYGYTYSQSIYDQSEISTAGNITKIAWQYTGGSWTDNIVIYMGNTTKSTFSSTSDWVNTSELSEVYNGTLSVASGWVEITLDNPFPYNGTDNLVIAVDENSSGYHSSGDDFYVTSCSGNKSIRYYSDGTNPDPASPPTGVLKAYRPNLEIEISSVPLPDMEFISSSCIQNENGNITSGTSDINLLSLQIETNNSANPLSLSNLTINLLDGTGTTDISDINNIRVYYSESSVFNSGTPGELFGTCSSTSGNIIINPDPGFSEVLSTGSNNYFHLVCDIGTTVSVGDTYDASIIGFTLSDATSETTNCNPAGSFIIDYCESYCSTSSNAKIDQVYLQGNTSLISQTSDPGVCEVYTDHTALSPADLSQTSNYNLLVTQGTCSSNFPRYCNAWADWNRDGDFNDANEHLNPSTSSNSSAGYVHDISFTVPADALPGDTRLRVLIAQAVDHTDPCGTYPNGGETEDYTITVVAPQAMEIIDTAIFHNNLSDINSGSTNQEILGIKLETQGNLSPIEISEINLDLSGVTDFSDISKVSIYFTEDQNSFSSTNPFGATTNITGSCNLSGSQHLNEGLNYFWIAFDIAEDATNYNFVDAACTSITSSQGSIIPTTPSPVGSRQIVNELSMTYGTNTYTTCGLTFYDNGGIGNDYDDYSNPATAEFYPATVGGFVEIDFSMVDLISGDYIEIYSGTGAEKVLLETITGSGIPFGNPYTSNASDGSLTFYFYQGFDSSHADGWVAEVSCAEDMYILSSDCTPVSTLDVDRNDTLVELIRLEIETNGGANALMLNEIKINLNGTDLISDISQLHIYHNKYDELSTDSLFASFSPVSGDITISGEQYLNQGHNVFFICADIAANATYLNYVDAECVSFSTSTSGTYIPTNNSAIGKRKINEMFEFIISMWDFSGNGWTSNELSVFREGVPVLTEMTLDSYENSSKWYEFTFRAAQGETISSVFTQNSTDEAAQGCYYFIKNEYGHLLFEDGSRESIPTGDSGIADGNIKPEYGINKGAFHVSSGTKSQSELFKLTDHIKDQTGSIWYKYQLDLNNDFNLEFDINLGDSDAGADGIVFAMQSQCITSGGSGSDIGFSGITPSLGIEFDTYTNASNGDSGSDHCAMFKNGSVNHTGGNELVSKVSLPDLESDTWYPVRIEWIAADTSFNMYFNGSATPTLSYQENLITQIFADQKDVYWGITSSTGEHYNEQWVRITDRPDNNSLLQDTSIYNGEAIQIDVASGGVSYNWEPNDGSIDDPTVYNPNFSPVSTQTYTVEIEDQCGNIIYDEFTITVNESPLPVELLEFEAACLENEILFNWMAATENNNDYYSVEFSSDGIDFQELKQISSQIPYEYQLSINEMPSGYYRLLQTDTDGTSEILEILYIDCNETNMQKWEVYPNPFGDYVWLTNEEQQELVSIEVLDQSGRTIFKENLPSGKQWKLSTHQLKPGSYLLNISNRQSNTKKLIIKL